MFLKFRKEDEKIIINESDEAVRMCNHEGNNSKSIGLVFIAI